MSPHILDEYEDLVAFLTAELRQIQATLRRERLWAAVMLVLLNLTILAWTLMPAGCP